MNEQELLTLINPIALTADNCLLQRAATGDADAIALVKEMGTKPVVEGQDLEKANFLMNAFGSTTEMRYKGTNLLFESTNITNFLDLPCGYTPRGIAIAREGKSFVGVDLPLVIGKMKPAVEKVIPVDVPGKASYHIADATNLESLRAALEQVEGELFISTEGLLNYLTQSELETFLHNIKSLLEDHGGMFCTFDLVLSSGFNQKLLKIILEEGSEDILQILEHVLSKVSDSNLCQSVIYNMSDDELDDYLASFGFKVERVPFSDYLPELVSLNNYTETIRDKAIDLYKHQHFIKLSIDTEISTGSFTSEQMDFGVEYQLKNKELMIEISGRLDSISSVDLLREFEAAKDGVTAITIDMKNLAYISSAGLRVLLIMYKFIKDKSKFQIHNANKVITEIMEMTGFAETFLR